MYIKNSIITDFGNFELDISAVDLHSQSGEDIKLPYTGVLPQQMSPASSAYIYFNVQPTHDINVVLVVNMESGKQMRRPLLVSNEELISSLDGFFNKSWENNGLQEYYFGLWYAHYIDWRKFVIMPNLLLNLISTFSLNDRMYIKRRIIETT